MRRSIVWLPKWPLGDQCIPDIKRRIALASCMMASLSKIWRDRRLSLTIKIRTYKALVLSTLLYAAETWTVRAEDARISESFHMKCQRQILGIRWQDYVRNAEVTIQTGLLQWLITSSNAAMLFSVTSPGCRAMSQYAKLYTARSTYLLVDFQTVRGNVVPVVLWNDGWIKSVTTANAVQPMCGETLSDGVITERRNGPRRLCIKQRRQSIFQLHTCWVRTEHRIFSCMSENMRSAGFLPSYVRLRLTDSHGTFWPHNIRLKRMFSVSAAKMWPTINRVSIIFSGQCKIGC